MSMVIVVSNSFFFCVGIFILLIFATTLMYTYCESVYFVFRVIKSGNVFVQKTQHNNLHMPYVYHHQT